MNKVCKHEFAYQESYKAQVNDGYAIWIFTKTDVYYCKFCLIKKEIIKSECLRYTPSWFK